MLAQRKFISFCQQLGKLHPSGSPCAVDEWTLCLFATFLARTIQPSSLKVYLSSVRALHVEQGCSDPFQDCLRLQRVVRGIKRCGGAPSSIRLPITDSLMLVIWKLLDLCLHDHIMFWGACTLGYFGFLRSAEFTVPNLASFSRTVRSKILDSTSSPSCMRVRRLFHLVRAATFTSVWTVPYLFIRSNSPGPLFLHKSGQPLTCALFTDWLRQIMAASLVSLSQQLA